MKLDRELLIDLALNGTLVERAAAITLLDEDGELFEMLKKRVMEVMQDGHPTRTCTTTHPSTPTLHKGGSVMEVV